MVWCSVVSHFQGHRRYLGNRRTQQPRQLNWNTRQRHCEWALTGCANGLHTAARPMLGISICQCMHKAMHAARALSRQCSWGGAAERGSSCRALARCVDTIVSSAAMFSMLSALVRKSTKRAGHEAPSHFCQEGWLALIDNEQQQRLAVQMAVLPDTAAALAPAAKGAQSPGEPARRESSESCNDQAAEVGPPPAELLSSSRRSLSNICGPEV